MDDEGLICYKAKPMDDADRKRLLKSLDEQLELLTEFCDEVYQYQIGVRVAESRAVALMREASDVAEIFYKSFLYKKPLDISHIKQELGDVIYNVQAVAKYMGFTLAECIESSNYSVRSEKLCQNI